MEYNRLREKFSYDESAGRFRHLLSGKGIKKGAIVKGKLMNTGYLSIWIDGKDYLYHRAVYLYHYGSLPEHLDHRDRDKSNPRIENLRPTFPHANTQNTDALGVHLYKATGKWQAQIQFLGVKHHIGYFDDKDSAVAARAAYKRRLLADNPDMEMI
jgi:hypothetical protein